MISLFPSETPSESRMRPHKPQSTTKSPVTSSYRFIFLSIVGLLGLTDSINSCFTDSINSCYSDLIRLDCLSPLVCCLVHRVALCHGSQFAVISELKCSSFRRVACLGLCPYALVYMPYQMNDMIND